MVIIGKTSLTNILKYSTKPYNVAGIEHGSKIYKIYYVLASGGIVRAWNNMRYSVYSFDSLNSAVYVHYRNL